MKRFILLLSVLSLTVACDELYGPEETPLTPDTAASVQISISDVTDNSFKVTVTPSGESSFYSYLVDESDAVAALDPTTLYEVGYTSVAQGTVDYAKTPSYTFEVAAEPNTTYQVYAVAGSPMGFPGDVAVANVTTSDNVAPAYASVQSEENEVLVTFSEAVTRGAGQIKVAYYAPYSSDFKTTAAPAGEVVVPEENIQVADNASLITVPEIPTGSYYTIDIAEGAFVDQVGHNLPAYKSTFVMGENGPAAQGFNGSVSYVELPMLGELDLESFAEWDNGFVIPVDFKYPAAGYSSKKFVTLTYESENKTVVHTLTPDADYALTTLGFVVNLPEQPVVGAYVTISVPAGCLYDIYGNDCEAWEHTMLYSYGYTLEDVLGTYAGEAVSYWDGPLELSFTVAESDDPESGNVMITGSYMGLPCSAGNIYADFNGDAGTLTIASGQVFYTEGEDLIFFAVNGADYVQLMMPESGVLTAPSAWFGAYINGAGWYDAYTECYLVKQEATEGAETAAKGFKPSSVARNF